MGFESLDSMLSPNLGCECCVRTGTMTISATSHKWTKGEIRARLVDLASELAYASWLDRGAIRRQIKHWAEKLQRFEEAQTEFDLNA